MNRHWDRVLAPLADAVDPAVVVEVGAEAGALTGRLLDWASSRDVTVHVIDPAPQFDVDEWRERHGERFVFHEGLSINVLGRLPPLDLVLIDGDHNWFTVSEELRITDGIARAAGRPAPVFALHDVGWPYGRRDMYYDPEQIPAKQRQPYARKGVSPDQGDLVANGGLNFHLDNAIHEGTRENGVLTALEDFVAASKGEWRVQLVDGLHGLAVAVPAERIAASPELEAVLDGLGSVEFLAEQVRHVEDQRVRTLIEAKRSRVNHEQALGRAAELEQELRGRISELESAQEEAEATIERHTALLEDRRDKLENTRRHAADVEERAAELKASLDETAQREAALRIERDNLEQDLDRRVGELKELRERSEQERERATEERERAAEERERAAAERAQVEAELAARTEEVTALETSLAERVAAHTALGDEITELRRRLGVAERDAKARQQSADELEQQLTAARQRLSAREEELAGAQARTAELEERVAAAEARAGEAQERAREAEAQAREAQARADGIAAAAAAARAEIADLEAAVTAEVQAAPVSALDAVAELSPALALDDPAAGDAEIQARKLFAAQYATIAGGDPFNADGIDRWSAPAPIDRRGILATVEEQAAASGPTADVVVPIHDALEDVRLCIWSLLEKTRHRFRLILVDDGSGESTASFLREFAAANPAVTLIVREPPHGFTLASNDGLRATTADYVVLLNSDTIVSHGWLERIVAAGEADPEIGVLGPLSNAASHQSVPDVRDDTGWAVNPLPPTMTVDGIAALVAAISPRSRPDMNFINGFCYVMRRNALDAIGLLDEEHFAGGYCEENDFSQRCRDAGFRLAVVDDGYVFHAKSKSYGGQGRNERAKANYQIFLDKHGPEKINELVREQEHQQTLEPLRRRLREVLADPAELRRALHAEASPLNVVFVLPGLGAGGSGGSHSVYQEVNGMRELGVPARIALAAGAWERAMAAYPDAEEVFFPFADDAELLHRLEGSDVVVATHFKSVETVARAHERLSFMPAYYVQDYEPFFALEPADVAEARASYTRMPDAVLFAKTHWLCNVVGRMSGVRVAKVEPSLDSAIYNAHGRPARHDGPLRVVGMIRPRTPRRQPHATIRILERLQSELGGDVEVVTFGCPDADIRKIGTRADVRERHRGILRRDEVADLLRSADVFVDVSTYQAFGRTALEAMACGATAVVPRLGGASQFARHDENALVVDTLDERAVYRSLVGLALDRERVARLQAEALCTAREYSITRASLSEYLLFRAEHRRLDAPLLTGSFAGGAS